MFLREPPKKQTRKELKVNLPASQHLRLRSLQALEGREAPGIVTEALQVYFARLAAADDPRTR